MLPIGAEMTFKDERPSLRYHLLHLKETRGGAMEERSRRNKLYRH